MKSLHVQITRQQTKAFHKFVVLLVALLAWSGVASSQAPVWIVADALLVS
jgi:hypothetical protein